MEREREVQREAEEKRERERERARRGEEKGGVDEKRQRLTLSKRVAQYLA